MKTFLAGILALGLLGSIHTSFAEGGDKEVVVKDGYYPVQKSLKQLRTFNGRINTKADYYIYLQSASWCPPCRAEMPLIAEAYEKMKKDGKVELILMSADKDKDSAEAFVKDNKASFPVIMGTDAKLSKVVGYKKASGIPNAIIVDKEGNVIKEGHGAIVKKWEEILSL